MRSSVATAAAATAPAPISAPAGAGTPGFSAQSPSSALASDAKGTASETFASVAAEPASESEYAAGLRRRAAKANQTEQSREVRAAAATPATAADGADQTPKADSGVEAMAQVPLAGKVPFASAVVAAAYQLQLIRLLLAMSAAALAATGQLATEQLSPLLQLIGTNVALIMSVAYVISKQPEWYWKLERQMKLRAGFIDKSLDSLVSAGFVQRRMILSLKAVVATGWAAYADSGCYLTVVIALYIVLRSGAPVAAINDTSEHLTTKAVSGSVD